MVKLRLSRRRDYHKVLPRERQREIEEDMKLKWQKQRWERCVHGAKNATAPGNRRILPWILQEETALRTLAVSPTRLHFAFLTSRFVRDQICVVFTHKTCDNLLQQHKKTTTYPEWQCFPNKQLKLKSHLCHFDLINNMEQGGWGLITNFLPKKEGKRWDLSGSCPSLGLWNLSHWSWEC